MGLLLTLPASGSNDDNIKIGILHSLSGTMATSELALKDTVLMLIPAFKSQGARPASRRKGSGY
jgi:urea transport system substrate-binding protein